MTQAYTDGSKNEQRVGSGVVIFAGKEIVVQIKLKLDSRFSHNLAEQTAIVNALEAIESLAIPYDSPSTATIYTDSRITLASLKGASNHAHFKEKIRKTVSALESLKLTIEFSWVKAHLGIQENELADRLANEAARNTDINIEFNRLPVSTYYNEIAEETRKKWQNEWEKGL